MDAKRVREIEEELQEWLPNGLYDANAQVVVTCQICNGATDDHKGNCVVPLVYELLDDAKSNARGLSEAVEQTRTRM